MHRLKIIGIFFGILIFALVLRLAYIQIIGHEELAAAARAQSLIALEGSNTRGIIYDRNGAPLVADEKQYIYIIKGSDFTDRAKELLLNIGAEPVSSDNDDYQVYSSEHYDKNTGSRLIKNNNAYILQASARYGDEQSAVHLIGYVNQGDQTGAAGLELMYDDQLSGLDRRVYAAADVKGNILPGRGLIITSEGNDDSYISEGIRTTIDKQLQQEVEDIIKGEEKDCAVVVLHSGTGGIAAMASTPGFDPDDVENIVSDNEADEDVLLNKVTQGEYPPGSVFKLVTAAAALENGIPVDKVYYCSGYEHLDGLTVKCDTGGETGHGEIGFKDAMAHSCNSYFIQLGQEIGADKIIETAEKMGLGREVLNDYPYEASGYLMTEAERAGNAIGNLSIGQGETLVTPLQIAAMTNILANDGIDKGVRLLMSEKQSEKQVISSETATAIRDMMKSVSTYGTGSLPGLENTAVKTGTAEYMAETGMRSHGWMTGILPCEEPEYVITVFVEDGGSGSGSAGPILKRIADYLEDSGTLSLPTLA